MLRTLTLLIGIAVNYTASAQSSEPDAKPVRLYPSPATTFLAVRLQRPHAQEIKILVRSPIGNVIATEKVYTDKYEVRLNIKDLPTGYYFISVRDEKIKRYATYRFLKR